MNLFPDDDKEHGTSAISCSRKPPIPQDRCFHCRWEDGAVRGGLMCLGEAGGVRNSARPRGLSMTGSNAHHEAGPASTAWVVSTVGDDGDPGAGKHVTCIFLTVGSLCVQFPCPTPPVRFFPPNNHFVSDKCHVTGTGTGAHRDTLNPDTFIGALAARPVRKQS